MSHVNVRDAIALIEKAVPKRSGTWADFGSGEGTFSRALVQLTGSESRLYAVDRDANALASLARWARAEAPNLVTVVADYSRSFELPGLEPPALDGMLFANSLHYVADQAAVLARLTRWLKPDGRAVFAEYDQRRATQWVPYPIPAARLPELAQAAGLTAPAITARRRS